MKPSGSAATSTTNVPKNAGRKAFRAASEATLTPTRPADYAKWLRREQAAILIGVSVPTMLNFEKRGWLHPQRVLSAETGHPVWVYDPEELAKIPSRQRVVHPKDEGDIAARAFDLFLIGRPLHAVVSALRQTPSKVRELHEQWLDMSGADLVVTPAAKEALEKLVGTFASVTELVELLNVKLGTPVDATEAA